MIKITKKTSYSTLLTIKDNNKKLKNSRGFTLIELMITVAIVGILAVVALPAYQDYVARSQVSEGLTLVSGAKPVIAEYYSNHGSYPTSSDIGFNGYTGSYVGTTTIGTDGEIVATFSDDAHRQLRGQTVTLTPEEVEETGNLRWNCSSSVDSKFLPTSCTNDGNTGNPGENPGNGGTDPTDPGGENPGGGETDPGEGEDLGTVTPTEPEIEIDFASNVIDLQEVDIGQSVNYIIPGSENINVVIDGVSYNISHLDHTQLEWSSPQQLPLGLSFNRITGMISGTPTQEGDYNFDIVFKIIGNPSTNEPLTNPVTFTIPGKLKVNSLPAIPDF